MSGNDRIRASLYALGLPIAQGALFTILGFFSLAFAFQFKESGVHSLMSFLLIGIGVDDMFVVCNAID